VDIEANPCHGNDPTWADICLMGLVDSSVIIPENKKNATCL
jgi:hypothetical protein